MATKTYACIHLAFVAHGNQNLNARRYPCGTLKGDDRSKQLVDGWIQNGFGLGGMIKSNIDKSVAGSLYAKEDSIKSTPSPLFWPPLL